MAALRRRVLVLGAGGFIGRRVVESLARGSWAAPVAACRVVRGASFPASAEVLAFDATDAVALRQALGGVAAVVNCVAGSAATITAGAAALVSATVDSSDPPRVVHLSSLAVYGRASGTVDESATLRGDLDAYSAAKAVAERTLRRLRSAVMLRPGIVYGPGSPWWSDRIARLLVARRLGDLGRRGEGICNLLFIDDAIAAIERALNCPAIEGEAFNLAADPAPTWNEYFRRYAAALEAQPVRQVTALRLACETRLVAPVLKVAELLARSRRAQLAPPIRPWLLERCQHAIRMDVQRATQTLGMQWTPLASGLELTARWFRGGGRTV